MPELRRDPVSDRWVIIAPDRARRPNEFHHVPISQSTVHCPFCQGHEKETPSPVLTYPRATGGVGVPGWQVRVVPNLYPALRRDLEFQRTPSDFFETCRSQGGHEVVIESPIHLTRTSEQDGTEIASVLRAYRDRMLQFKTIPTISHVLPFKNVGLEAGASLEHTHSQIAGLPVVPPIIQHELTRSEAHFRKTRGCIFCELVSKEKEFRDRIVIETDRFLTICPFASRFAFELTILPTIHLSNFEEQGDDILAELGVVLFETMKRLDVVADDPPYNYLVHSAPFDTECRDHYHWHIEILPRIAKAAGFEWGTGVHINLVSPEDAAERLRSVSLNEGTSNPEDISNRKTS